MLVAKANENIARYHRGLTSRTLHCAVRPFDRQAACQMFVVVSKDPESSQPNRLDIGTAIVPVASTA